MSNTERKPLIDENTVLAAAQGYVLIHKGSVGPEDKERVGDFAEGVRWARGFVEKLITSGELQEIGPLDADGNRIGYDIRINPKASPQNVPFEVALAYLKAGRRVKLAGAGVELMKTEIGIYHVPGGPNGGLPYTTMPFDLLSTDWYVIPEQP